MNNQQQLKGPKKQSIRIEKKSIDIENQTIIFEDFEKIKRNQQKNQGTVQNAPQPIESQTHSQQPVSPHRNLRQQQQQFTRVKVHNLEIFFELIILTLLVYSWVYFMKEYNQLKQRVPVSFDIDGSVDTVDKDNFFLLISIDTFCYLLNSLLQLLPHKFKYLVEVTDQNSKKIFLLTRVFIMYLKMITVIIFLYAIVALYQIVKQKWHPILMYATSVLVLFYFIGSYAYYKILIRISINPLA